MLTKKRKEKAGDEWRKQREEEGRELDENSKTHPTSSPRTTQPATPTPTHLIPHQHLHRSVYLQLQHPTKSHLQQILQHYSMKIQKPTQPHPQEQHDQLHPHAHTRSHIKISIEGFFSSSSAKRGHVSGRS
ncbi:hypothetical protein KM043_003554 [Ampulex compressa]|nr:hypothetical protein KM043_003554 [Ampulex compressa]